MLPIPSLKLGFSDAENYQRRENKDLFNAIFVQNAFLEELLQPNSFFLIGEKGTGKTAYAVYLSNNLYNNTMSNLKYIRETDYQKFVTLKKQQHLLLSDYTSIWRVILLLLLAKSINADDLAHNPFSKNHRIKAILKAVDDYYNNAFSPEIICALDWIENSKVTAELVAKNLLKIGGEDSINVKSHESRFQVNLLYLQKQFEDALAGIKLRSSQILFIDGIDIRPGTIEYRDYLDCIKGLANAVWSLNNDYFPKIKDSKGRLRVILLVRPDIFSSLGLQNTTNKVRDNSVYLDWRTTYPSYRTSRLFELSDRLLAAQQETRETRLELGHAWDYYFPWQSYSTNPKREKDPSFIGALRLTYSRPRDIVTLVQILQEEFREKRCPQSEVFKALDLESNDFKTKYSEYLMGEIKDQLAFYYNDKDYEIFLRFFVFLNGRVDFDYNQYVAAYEKFTEYILDYCTDIPEFVESPDKFIQFLYETNIICHIDDTENEPLFRWCYRERGPSNIAPKVNLDKRYRIHYGLHKALNLGAAKYKMKK
ncbi:MAG: funZ protein [Candidatus Aminicenantes bacterium]|nr:funZ protein [Candidatus Aminicenantes bacterium]